MFSRGVQPMVVNIGAATGNGQLESFAFQTFKSRQGLCFAAYHADRWSQSCHLENLQAKEMRQGKRRWLLLLMTRVGHVLMLISWESLGSAKNLTQQLI